MSKRGTRPSAVPTPSPEELEHISPPLRPFAVLVETLDYDPTNTRQHPEDNTAATESSMKMYGQQLPLVHDPETNIMRVGNNRLRIARERLNWKWIASVPTSLAGLDAELFAALENRSGEMAKWITPRMGELLTKAVERGDDVLMYGFTSQQASSFGVDWSLLKPKSKAGAGERFAEQWGVLVECADEAEQMALLERLNAEGLRCRALIS